MSSEDFSSLLPGPGSLIRGGAGCSSLCIGGGGGRVGGGVSGCLVVAGVIGLLVTGLGSGLSVALMLADALAAAFCRSSSDV